MTKMDRPEFWHDIVNDDVHKAQQDYLVYEVEFAFTNMSTDRERVIIYCFLALGIDDAISQAKEYKKETWKSEKYLSSILSVSQTGQRVLFPHNES